MKLSAKAAGIYLDCPKQYRFEYVDRPRMPRRGGPWAHLTRGNVLHEVLAEWMTLDPHERTVDRALRMLDARWRDDGFRDGEQAGLHFAIAAEWIERYCSRPEVQATVVRGNERNVEWVYRSEKLSRSLTVMGRVDRIDQRDGRLVVVDYKTGKKPPDIAEASGSYALAIYAFAITRLLGRAYGWCTRAELHHLPTGEIMSVEYDRERIARVLDRLVDLAGEIEAATKYPARPSGLCASCSFLDYCDEGKARTTRADGWAYLDQNAVTPAM